MKNIQIFLLLLFQLFSFFYEKTPIRLACIYLRCASINHYRKRNRSKHPSTDPFVTIVEEGTQNGTYSDIDGYFSIKLMNENSNIIFSYLGYETKFLAPVKNILWNVAILPQAFQIKEVKILPGENHKKNLEASTHRLRSG